MEQRARSWRIRWCRVGAVASCAALAGGVGVTWMGKAARAVGDGPGIEAPSSSASPGPVAPAPRASEPALDPLDYLPSTPIPAEEQVQGVPWLRRVPGLVYVFPRRLSAAQWRQVTGFEDLVAMVADGVGDLVEEDGRRVLRLLWIDSASPLTGWLGLQEEDRVVSINGVKVDAFGGGSAALRRWHDHLRDAPRIAVHVVRYGQGVILSFEGGP